MKIGFLGCGNMGGAMLIALIKYGQVDPSSIIACTKTTNRHTDLTEKFSITVTTKQSDLESCDVIFLGIKPYQFSDIHFIPKPKAWIVNMMSGISIADLKTKFPNTQIVQIMPNIAVQHGSGVTGSYSHHTIPGWLKTCIYAGALPVKLNSEQALVELTKLSGCGPGVLAMLSQWILDGVDIKGVTDTEKQKIWLQTCLGTIDLMKDKDSFEDLYQAVASPQGLTEAIVTKLKATGVPVALKKSLE